MLILTEAYICFGYDASIIGGVLAMPAFVQRFGITQADGTKILTASRVSVITATRTSGAVPAVFACQILGNKWGRKKTIWFGCAVCLLGTALQTGSINEAMITIGLTIASASQPWLLAGSILTCGYRLRLLRHGIYGLHVDHRDLSSSSQGCGRSLVCSRNWSDGRPQLRHCVGYFP